MVVWSSDLGVPVEVSSLPDFAFGGCTSVTGSGSPSISPSIAVLHLTVDVDICSVSVLAYQDAPAWCIMYLYGHKVQLYVLVVTELPHGYFVCEAFLCVGMLGHRFLLDSEPDK